MNNTELKQIIENTPEGAEYYYCGTYFIRDVEFYEWCNTQECWVESTGDFDVRRLSDIRTILAQAEEIERLKAELNKLKQSINSKLYDFTPRHAVIQEILDMASPLTPPEGK